MGEWDALLEAEEGTPWNATATELLVQPNMYGRFMEYGHNGARSVNLPRPSAVHQCLRAGKAQDWKDREQSERCGCPQDSIGM